MRGVLRILLLFFAVFKLDAVPLRVAVPVEYPPFAYEDGGVLRGLSVDVWREIAEKHKISYKFIPLKSDMETLYKQLGENKYDVLLGPVAIDTQMLEKITYTLPYFLNQGAVLSQKKRLSLRGIIDSIFSNYVRHVLLFYVLFLFVYFHIILFVERRTSIPSEIPKGYKEGITFLIAHHFPFQNMFFSIKKDKLSHALYIAFFYVHGPFVAVLSGAVASVLTVSLSSNHKVVLQSSDLEQKKFAYVENRSVYEGLAEKLNINAIAVSSLEKGVALIREEKISGIIEDSIELEAYIKEKKLEDMDLAPFRVGYLLYSFALSPVASKYVTLINRNIIDLHLSGTQAMIAQKYDIMDKKQSLLYY